MYCKDFAEISKDDVSIAGGKGANLAEMSNIGVPVPPGMTVGVQGQKIPDEFRVSSV